MASVAEEKKTKDEKKDKWIHRPPRIPTSCAVIPKGYHTYDERRHGGAQLWSTGAGGGSTLGPARVIAKFTRLHHCTSAKCDKQEKIDSNGKVQQFQHCKKCNTVYCSPECATFDHLHGQHKVKCKTYRDEEEKERLRYADCPTCSKTWNKVDFMLCRQCFFAP